MRPLHNFGIVKACLYLLFSLIVLFSAHFFYLYQHRSFSPQQFEHPSFFSKFSNSLEPRQQLAPLLTQPFFYLGEGRQMTAFESLDGKYVIKFFHPWTKPREYTAFSFKKFWKLFFPKTWKSTYFQREKKIHALGRSYEMIFNQFPEDKSLIFVHLHSADFLPCSQLKLYDRKGESHTIDLTKAPFVLQKKAELVIPYLDYLLKIGDQDKIKELLISLNRLFTQKSYKGLYDKGQALASNFGFLEGSAVQIDWGMVEIREDILQHPEKERNRVIQKASSYLERLYPEIRPLLFYLKEVGYGVDCMDCSTLWIPVRIQRDHCSRSAPFNC